MELVWERIVDWWNFLADNPFELAAAVVVMLLYLCILLLITRKGDDLDG